MAGDSSFFKSQIVDAQKKSIFFSELRRLRAAGAEEDRDNWKWEPPYKMYPSAMTFNMCLYEYFRNAGPMYFKLDAIYKMKAGSSWHHEMQKDFLQSKLIHSPPVGLDKEQLRKLDYNWPEIPFTEPESMISGRVDLMLDLRGRALITELKRTFIPEDNWEKHKEKRLPDQRHICQVSIYRYCLEKMKMYDNLADKMLLAYQNGLMPCWEQDSEHEVIVPWEGDLQEKTHLLVTNSIKERNAFINDKESNCTYKLCSKHNRRR